MTIDWWTLGLQTVNVLVLVWLLGHFFWRPVAGMIAQRRAAAQKMLADAQAQQQRAGALLAEVTRTRAGFAQEREAILKAARDAAAQAREALLQQATKEAEAVAAAARAALAKEKEEADKAWAERASRLALDIARRLAARLDGAAVQDAFLGWLVAEIRNLPRSERQAAGASGVTLEAVSAAPLQPAEQEHCRGVIAAALGADPSIIFKTDPTLIAGLELHGPHLVVANSWRADLKRILADMADDQRS